MKAKLWMLSVFFLGLLMFPQTGLSQDAEDPFYERLRRMSNALTSNSLSIGQKQFLQARMKHMLRERIEQGLPLDNEKMGLLPLQALARPVSQHSGIDSSAPESARAEEVCPECPSDEEAPN